VHGRRGLQPVRQQHAVPGTREQRARVSLAVRPLGYIGISLAEQYGFNAPQTDGPDENEGPPSSQFATSTAIIETLNNDISDDVILDPDLIRAQHNWSACMARNGYDSAQPDSIWHQYLRPSGNQPAGGPGPGGGANSPASLPTPSPAQNQAQIAAAVTDTNCTLSTDLGGIYFAIQTSYEQQFVTANQQALNASVHEYKANFAKELSQLPALLHATSATLPTAPGNRRWKAGSGHCGGLRTVSSARPCCRNQADSQLL
jgi:hypothetical protein